MVKLIKGVNDLATLRPDLAAQWHPTKNGDLKPTDVTQHSGIKVWWICPFGHEWQSTINNRSNGNGCPVCNSESQTSFPEQAIYYYLKQIDNTVENRKKINGKYEVDVWIPSKNTAIEYDGWYYHDNKNSERLEQKKNDYLKTLGIQLIRVRELENAERERCAENTIITFYCIKNNIHQLSDVIKELIGLLFVDVLLEVDANRDATSILELYKQDCLNNSLATTNPELAKQWHPTKNGTLTPEMFTEYSSVNVWWICSLGHEWEARIADRSNGNNCPICSGRHVLIGYNDLATLRPDLALQWHPTKNGDLTPYMFVRGSHKKVCWKCPKGHEWEATIGSRSAGQGCPICSGNKILVGYNDLTTTDPELANQWHPTKNGTRTPEMYSKGSGEKAWWICPLGHEWEARIADRSRGRGCPICSGRQVLKGFNDLATTNPQLASEWHQTKNDGLTPEMVTLYSGKKTLWSCSKGHEWESTIANRANGNSCPVCSKINRTKNKLN